MAASQMTLAERFVPPSEEMRSGYARLVRFSRSDVLALLRLGIIPEDASTELLDGVIVLKDRSARGEDVTSVGKNHATSVELLSNLRSVLNSSGRHVRSQQPLDCRTDHTPEPDMMVLRGTVRDYLNLPRAADAFCIVEVADSSYERDSGSKLRDYARAGIAQYIIINLRNRTAETYTQPNTAAGTFAPPIITPADGVLSLRVGDAETFDVRMTDVLA